MNVLVDTGNYGGHIWEQTLHSLNKIDTGVTCVRSTDMNEEDRKMLDKIFVSNLPYEAKYVEIAKMLGLSQYLLLYKELEGTATPHNTQTSWWGEAAHHSNWVCVAGLPTPKPIDDRFCNLC